MLTKHMYETLQTTWDKKIKECCQKPHPDIPPGSDCCYDKWTEELKSVNKVFKEADEEAKQKTAEFSYVSDRRDQFKKWYDELTKVNELGTAICDQLNVLYGQVVKIGINTQFTVDAVKILFCMIRDYYLQLDKLKEKYDALLNCIKCLNNPGLVPGTGLMKLIEAYGAKLLAAQASRDDLLILLMSALGLAEKIDLNTGPDYGLQTVVAEWKNSMNCDENCEPGSNTGDEKKKMQSNSGNGGIKSTGHSDEPDECELRPILKMPVSKDPYYEEIRTKYDNDKAEADELASELLSLNSRKESLLACKQSLEAAIKEVNPIERNK